MKIKGSTAVLLVACSAVWSQPPIRLKSRMPPGSDRARQTAAAHERHHIVQFASWPGPAVRAELERRGMRVLGYVPDNALMVAGELFLDGLDISSVSVLKAADKISPLLSQQATGPLLVEFYPDVDPAAARAAAAAAGFEVIENPGLLPGQLVLSGSHSRIEAMAEAGEVSYILPAAPELAAGEVLPGCAGALSEAGAIADYVLVGNGWPKDAAGNVAIRYFIRSLTDKIDAGAARAEIERALREWARYGGFTATTGDQSGGERSIDILFARGAHGDAYPFDGPGGTLGHTFYPAPPNSETIAGDMHLDADESWSIAADIDLFSVALHEFGHALGLGHSDRPGAVMYPYYRMTSGLTDDDIAGIQALYPASVPASAPAPAPTPVPTPAPSPPTPPSVPPAGGDTTPPTLQITSPGSTIVSTTAASLKVSGTAADNIGVASVNWSTSGGDSGTASGTTSWNATVPLYAGTNVVTIRAWDAAGNSAWRAMTVVRR